MRFQVLLLLDKINRKLSYEGFVTYPSEKGLIVNRGFHHSLSTEVNPANDLIFMHYRGNDEPIFRAIRLKVNNGIKQAQTIGSKHLGEEIWLLPTGYGWQQIELPTG